MRAFAFGLALLASPAAAQELPSLDDFLAETEGREIQATGEFQILVFNDEIGFENADGLDIPVKFALDRTDLAAVETCVQQGECKASIKAEVGWSYHFLTLTVFEVTLL